MIVHCLGSLFVDTVHEHCSEGKKKRVQNFFKYFLVYDLIYEIFIWKLI